METKDKIKLRMKALGLKSKDLASQSGASKGSVSQWLSGTSKPSSKYVGAVCEVLECDPKWLLTDEYGEMDYFKAGVQLGEALVDGAISALKNPLSRRRVGMVPLVSWVNAGCWEDPIDNYCVGDAEEWLPCPTNCKQATTFVLEVNGDSMDDGTRNGYRDGEKIFVDGSVNEPAHNADVIIKNGGGKVTFKRLVHSNGDWFLKPLNPTWPEPTIRLDEGSVIVGRVMFSGMTR